MKHFKVSQLLDYHYFIFLVDFLRLKKNVPSSRINLDKEKHRCERKCEMNTLPASYRGQHHPHTWPVVSWPRVHGRLGQI